MEESPCRQFKGDRNRGMLTMRQRTQLQIRVLTDTGLQVKQGRISVTTVKRKAILLDNALNQNGLRIQNAFQTNDLDAFDSDAFDSDCDDIPSAKAVLMANLSSYESNVLSEVPSHETNIENNMNYQSVQENHCFEQPSFDNDTEVNITSDNNIISYEQYLQETKTLVVQSTCSSEQQDALLMSVIEEMSSQIAKCNKVIVDRNAKVAAFEKQIHSLKLQLNATVKSHKTLSKTIECLKKESKQKEGKYLDEVIDLQKKNKALDNVVYKMGQSTQTINMLTKPQAFYDETHKTALGYQNPFYHSQARQKVPALYDGNTIVKTHIALSVTDGEEILELAKETYYLSRWNIVMHANDHSDNVLHVNNNSLKHDNSTLELLKHENDRLIELLIYQDLVHTAVNSLAAIKEYKSMQQSFMDEYNETLVLKAELAKKNDMIENVVYNELSKRCFRLEN
ncbi:hypothetical protein Tco_1501637 [Tanacetum coccineum]